MIRRDPSLCEPVERYPSERYAMNEPRGEQDPPEEGDRLAEFLLLCEAASALQALASSEEPDLAIGLPLLLILLLVASWTSRKR